MFALGDGELYCASPQLLYTVLWKDLHVGQKQTEVVTTTQHPPMIAYSLHPAIEGCSPLLS